MTDIVSSETRSRMMSGIRGKNTRPEHIVRKLLFMNGFRYRLHQKELDGKPDLVLPKYRSVIFVNGCFWHRHDCHLFKWPSSNERFWREKLEGNLERDKKSHNSLMSSGWRVLIVWECAVKGKYRLNTGTLSVKLANWLKSDSMFSQIGSEEQGVSDDY